jgi:tRNA(adenine34) deaminase
MTDQDFMALALAEAKQAGLRGEVPVGAILVKDGEVIASVSNAVISLHDPSAHAEVLALRVTLEPCAMCAAAMIHARISRVVYGASDPKTGAAGGLLNVFDTTFNHQTKVQGGVMANECGELLRDFFKTKRSLAKG